MASGGSLRRGPPRWILAWLLCLGVMGLALDRIIEPPRAGAPEAVAVQDAPAAAAFVVRGVVLWEAGDDTLRPPEKPCRATLHARGESSAPASTEADGGFVIAWPASWPSRETLKYADVSLECRGRLRALIDVPHSGDVGRIALGEAARPLDVVVTDERGEAVADVLVRARPNPDLGERVPWQQRTGKAGDARFETLPWGPVVLQAHAPGFAPITIEAISPGPEVELVLSPYVELKGRVTGPPEAVAAARVRVEGSSVWPAQQWPVRFDGGFKVGQLSDGVFALEAVSTVGGKSYAATPIWDAEVGAPLALELRPAVDASFVVVDDTDTPVDGARISLAQGRLGLLQRRSTTGPDGSAVIPALLPGEYEASVDAPQMLPTALRVVLDQSRSGPTRVVLRRPAAVRVRVVDPSGDGVIGARVEIDGEGDAEGTVLASRGQSKQRERLFSLTRSGSLGVTRGPVPAVPAFDPTGQSGDEGADSSANPNADPELEWRTGEDGEVTLEGLLPGHYRLQALHESHAVSARVAVELGPGLRDEPLVLTLRTGTRVTGRVRDDNGRPVAQATAALDGGAAMVVSDERGVFDLGSHRGRVAVVVRAPGMVPQRHAVRLGNDAGPPADLELTMVPAIGEVRGEVVDHRGEPVPFAYVELQPKDDLSPTRDALTDARGGFVFEGLTPIESVVRADHPGHTPAEREWAVAAGDARVAEDVLRLVLRPTWTLEVRVEEVVSRAPVSGAEVRAAGRLALSDADGVAILSGLPRARAPVRVDVTAAEFADASTLLAVPDAGVERLEWVTALQGGGSIRGRVTDDLGDPVRNAVIEVLRNGRVIGRAMTDEAGDYQVGGLEEGDVIVRAQPPSASAALLAPTELHSDIRRAAVTSHADLRFDRL